jgi:hypothetical protein
MKYRSVLSISILAILAHSASATSSVKLASAGTMNLQNVSEDQWPTLAQQEINTMGPIVGIPGGVVHSIPENQRSGEDCWSFALSQKIQSYLLAKGFKFPLIRLSPEYLEFWHIYSQIQINLDDFSKAAKTIKSHPANRDAQIEKLKVAFSLIAAPQQQTKSKSKLVDNLVQPDVGNDAATAIDEIEQYGVAPVRAVKVEIKTDDQETKLETEISNLTGQIILDQIQGTANLSEYKETNPGQINEKLFQLLKTHLDPIFKASMIRPTDSWNYQGKFYTPQSLYGIVKNLGLDFKKDFKPLTATRSTHATALKAIAISLLTDNQPVPIGISLYSDAVNAAGKTATDFAENSGLFTSSICHAPSCKTENGGHEILVVNFLGVTSDGSPLKAGLSNPDKIAMLQSGELTVKELIIENSWGNLGGMDVNGQIPRTNFKLQGGYYVLTSDFLLNSGLPVIDDMYDFVLPSSIAAQFSQLKKSE